MSSTTEVVPFAPDHLDQLTELLNAHLDAVVPGVALPGAHLAERLVRDPGEAIVDPWVVRRRTLVAVERDRVVAASHLLHYGATSDVGPGYRNVGEIAWLVAWPSACAAAEAVLAAGLRQLDNWGAEAPRLCTGSMFVPTVSGVPDTWPHIEAILRAAGYAPEPEREEVLYGDAVPAPRRVRPDAGDGGRRRRAGRRRAVLRAPGPGAPRPARPSMDRHRGWASGRPPMTYPGCTSPMSSCHSAGSAAMNSRMSRRHSAESRLTSSTPCWRSRPSAPRNVAFSPMTTRRMP